TDPTDENCKRQSGFEQQFARRTYCPSRVFSRASAQSSIITGVLNLGYGLEKVPFKTPYYPL
ncbi:MAG: hypothetical protein WBE73_06980, partial [Candidatus Acidiferrum sp.]